MEVQKREEGGVRMGCRTYDIHLACGCMLSLDGGGGCMPCYAEYGDMRKKKDREALGLCKKSWKEYLASPERKLHDREIARRNQ